jgi:hypothetical protein
MKRWVIYLLWTKQELARTQCDCTPIRDYSNHGFEFVESSISFNFLNIAIFNELWTQTKTVDINSQII